MHGESTAPGCDERVRLEPKGSPDVLDLGRTLAPVLSGDGLADCHLADDPRRAYVEFTLEPVAEGTRLTVVESGFAQLPDDLYSGAYGGNVEGWQSELGELAEYLDARA